MKYVVFLISFLGLLIQISVSQNVCRSNEIFTQENCVGDDFSESEKDLYRLVNDYRQQNNLSSVPVSQNLCKVANRHILDIQQNLGTLTHDWSNCKIDKSKPDTANCVYKAPQKFDPDYKGLAFENLYSTSRNQVVLPIALQMWKRSPLHNSLILNLNSFKDIKLRSGCVAISGKYAALWFDSDFDQAGTISNSAQRKGLGVSLKQAVEGLDKIVPIVEDSSIIDSKRWVGKTPNKSVVIEMLGLDDEINEGSVSLKIKLEMNAKLSVVNRHIIETFLKNLSPKWSRRNVWLKKALVNIKSTPKETQKIDIQELSVELKVTPDNYIVLNVKPATKPTPVEF